MMIQCKKFVSFFKTIIYIFYTLNRVFFIPLSKISLYIKVKHRL